MQVEDSGKEMYVQRIPVPSLDGGEESGVGEGKVGKVKVDWDKLQGTTGWKALSLVRAEPTWIQPHLYASLSSHSPLASHLLLLKSPDWSRTLVVYPISTLEVVHHLRIHEGEVWAEYTPTGYSPSYGDDEGNVTGQTEKGKEGVVWVVCYEAAGKVEERRAVGRVVEKARELVGGGSKSGERREGMWDGLGVCTWESFLQPDGSRARPTLDLLLSVLPSFPIKTFLIDDGWQDTSSTSSLTDEGSRKSRLHSFHPYSDLTPTGGDMKEVVKALKERGVEKVGVWLTLQGYWLGIDPDSELCGRYECHPHDVGRFDRATGEVVPDSETGTVKMWLPSPEKAGAFWKDWFGLIKSWGVDFVKVDNQSFYDKPISPHSPRAVQALWSAMLKAVVNTWGSLDAVIMCMSHSEVMLNGPGGLDFGRPHGQLIFRNSDDFALQYPKAHVDHIYNNLYTSMLTSHLSLTPDFDMFASSPSTLLPTYHALLRALGPGPLLLSDTPTVTSDEKLLNRLVSRRKNGTVGAVKADKAAQVISRRWFWDNLREGLDGPALLAGSEVEGTGGGMMGLWNVHDPDSRQGTAAARDTITYEDVADLLDLEQGDGGEYSYILYPLGLDGKQKQPTMVSSSRDKGMAVVLETHSCEAVVVSKVHELARTGSAGDKEEERGGGVKVALLGMLDKLVPLAGITDVDIEETKISFSSTFCTTKLAILVISRSNAKPGIRVTVDGASSGVEVEQLDMESGEEERAWLVHSALEIGHKTDSGSRAGQGWRVQFVL